MQSEDYPKLRECPFCGGEVKLDADDFYMFCCDKCGAGITFAKVFEDGTAGDCSEDESVSAWNRRAQPVPTVDAVEVVRCRDCVHFGECLVTENDYCSKGERKETD